jgi:hypothetical protein
MWMALLGLGVWAASALGLRCNIFVRIGVVREKFLTGLSILGERRPR